MTADEIYEILKSNKTVIADADIQIVAQTKAGFNYENEVIHYGGGAGSGSSGGGSISIEVDSALSTTSLNPVQNRIITNALNKKQDIVKDSDLITPQEVSDLFKEENNG